MEIFTRFWLVKITAYVQYLAKVSCPNISPRVLAWKSNDFARILLFSPLNVATWFFFYGGGGGGGFQAPALPHLVCLWWKCVMYGMWNNLLWYRKLYLKPYKFHDWHLWTYMYTWQRTLHTQHIVIFMVAIPLDLGANCSYMYTCSSCLFFHTISKLNIYCICSKVLACIKFCWYNHEWHMCHYKYEWYMVCVVLTMFVYIHDMVIVLSK